MMYISCLLTATVRYVPIDIAYTDRGIGALARNFSSPPAPFSPSHHV